MPIAEIGLDGAVGDRIPMKLGEHLVRKRVIDAQQLEAALSDQLVHGGSLGTCLI